MDLTNLDPTEIDLILSALETVSPSGGNSPQYGLFRQLRDQTGIEPTRTIAFIGVVEREIDEHREWAAETGQF